MQAIRIARHGGPEVLELVELPTPNPGDGEALVRVVAAGVNFMDVYQRTGQYPREPPFTPGEEGAGVVVAVGPGVDLVRPGDRVAWSSVSGSYATHVVARAEKLVVIPDGLDERQAAGAMLQGMTAHYLTHSTFPLAEGHACLVHAAAGGVGHLLVQMAKRRGAFVIGTTSNDDKAKLVWAAGADHVMGYTPEPFDEVVRSRTEGRGADVVYDSVGAATFERSLLSLKPRATMVLFGQSSGRVPPVDLQILNTRGSLFVTRPTLRDYVATRAELTERADAVLGAVVRGELTVRIHEELPLSRAADAHRALESRKTTGKLVLVMG
jgi:NADPH2:quinone reductase